jgi:sulfur-oxidizing protein SoxZ
MARALIQVPASARRGEMIAVRTLIGHPMETGYRPDANGVLLPQDIIRRFSCHYNGELVFSAELSPAIAANPYLAFHVQAGTSGPLVFTWEGDRGFTHTETTNLSVVG